MSEKREGSSQIPPKRVSLNQARHFERDGFSGDQYVEANEGFGFSAINVDVHGRHPKKKMIDATRAYLVIEGTGTFNLNGQLSEVKKGDLFIIPNGGEYAYQGQMKLFEFNVPGTTSVNSISLDNKQDFVSESKSGIFQGRDFLKVTKDIEYSSDKQKAMQSGDFINMPWKTFSSWHGKNEESYFVETLPKTGNTTVRILEIKKDGEMITDLVVEAGGLKRTIPASLFYNYGVFKNH
jgi:quercetin dioxygenase-like cupin family protein